MTERLSIGVVGAGALAPCFIPLFMAHPYVAAVTVCDLVPERAEEMRRRFGCGVAPSFEALLEDAGVNCVALFTERHRHGPMALRALEAGKHVYSSVPMASTVEECKAIVDMVRRTELTYMLGETCYYYPCACKCRALVTDGCIGAPVYVAAQYYHDLAGFHYPRLGEGWQRVAGLPPMLYPTHSFSMALSAMDAHVTSLSCQGVRDIEDDGVFGDGCNLWDNPFSCETALARLSNGATARVSEFRRVGVRKPSSYISALYGTDGAYEYNLDRHLYTRKRKRGGEDVSVWDVSAEVNPREMTQHRRDADFLEQVANGAWAEDSFAPCQPFARLPESYRSMPNGHMATHQLLADDFCRAAHDGALPPLNAWFAARCNLPGLIAHESAMRNGERLDVPDLGDAPASLARLA